jgi:glyoxylase-like metal-dependent hydrolase (beta-lactamase superfamily II)
MNQWRIDIVDVATIPQLPLSGFLPEAGLAEAGLAAGADELVDVPCFAFLLSSPAGTVVVDTGPDPVRAAQTGFEARGRPRQAMLAALAERGRSPADVDVIVHTHLHYDHMQNDDIFPRATVVVQEREARWAAGAAAEDFCISVADFLSGLAGRLRLIDGELDIFPGVRLVLTAGHTPGHQAVLVNTAAAGEAGTSATCIAGDLVPLRANARHLQPLCRDPGAVRAFLERARRERWRLIPSHDPDMRADPTGFLKERSSEIASGQ